MLRKMLSQRGLECKGCVDKEEYVNLAFTKQHLPILPPPSEEEPVKDEASKKKEVDDVSVDSQVAASSTIYPKLSPSIDDFVL